MRVGIALALAFAAAVPAFAQAPIPRTADGHPDFQGVWDAPWLTPMERPQGMPRLVVTEDEAREIAAPRRLLPSRNALNVPSVLDSTDYGSLAKVRGERRTSLIIDPPDGRTPYTPAGQAIMAVAPSYEGPETMQLQSRCLVASGAPPMFILPADTLRQFVQTPDSMVILSEAFNDLRIIPVRSAHRPSALTSLFGDSVGWWEDHVFVVETTHYRSDGISRTLASMRIALGPNTRVIERFELLGPDEILYRFNVSDPDLYLRPVTGEYTLLRVNQRIYETACHEGNYALPNMLGGAREAERRPAKTAIKP